MIKYKTKFLYLELAFLVTLLSMGCDNNRTKNLASAEQPNIVLIVVDDLGWTDLGCFGSSFYETPNIDKLAAGGMRFTNFYAAASLCSPTRASILTGKYPARIGVTNWIKASFQPGFDTSFSNSDIRYEVQSNNQDTLLTPVNPLWLENDEVTIAEVLKKWGYVTCHIGKWHLGPEGHYPQDQGFDINIGGCDFGEPPSFFDPYSHEGYPELNYDPIDSIPNLPSRAKGEYLTDREIDEALHFIRNNDKGPFFLNLWHYAVHVPIEARDSLIEKYRNKPVSNHTNPVYAAMIESVDQGVGKIYTLLSEMNLIKNTVIIFTSDNGGFLYDYFRNMRVTDNTPLRSGKGTQYEGGIRIPLIVHWNSKINPGTISDALSSTIDFFPTLSAIASIQIPDTILIDGKDMTPVLFEKKDSLHNQLIWHYPHFRSDDVSPHSIIRKDEWKYIRYYTNQTNELYNLNDDVGEKNNLIHAKKELAAEMESELMNRLNEMNAKFPQKLRIPTN